MTLKRSFPKPVIDGSGGGIIDDSRTRGNDDSEITKWQNYQAQRGQSIEMDKERHHIQKSLHQTAKIQF